jgi:PIN domain nuclease of toxin-antitoxin system
VNLLLDTHALAWWLLDDPRLSKRVAALISDTATNVHVSAVSAYEAALKHRLGKWPEAAPLAGAFEQIVAAEGFNLLPVTGRHAARAGFFNAAHRDPFDRILAAQAEIEELTLATNDGRFADFGTRTVWD